MKLLYFSLALIHLFPSVVDVTALKFIVVCPNIVYDYFLHVH